MKNKIIVVTAFMLFAGSPIAMGAEANTPQIAIPAEEPDSRTPIERYHGDSWATLEISRLKFKTFMITNAKSDLDDFYSEVEKRQKKVKESLKEALKTVNNAKAQEALKTYHVAVMSALKSIPFSLDERAISYEERQRALEDKVTEAWERFEIER